MADPNAAYNSITATTIENRSRKLADNVTNHNALLYKIKEKGGVREVSGGSTIVEEIEFEGNDQAGWYFGLDQLSTQQTTVHTVAEYELKQLHIPVVSSGRDALQNAGKEQMIDLIKTRVSNAEKTMMNQIAAALYSDGTEDGGNIIGGLQLLVPQDPTVGTVGGIDRATYEFWQSYTSSDVATLNSTTIQGHMEDLAINVVRGKDGVDLFVGDAATFKAFWDSLQTIQRISDPNMGKAGFKNLVFMGPSTEAPVVYDDQCPANTMYGLNLDYMKFRPHSKRNMVSKQIEATDQDGSIVHIFWAGALTLCNSARQGIIYT